jgi:hypothetical protein
MVKLKLGVIPDDKPVKLVIEIPATTHRDLLDYAEALGRETGQSIPEPARLVAPMIIRFMATDRAFLKAKRNQLAQKCFQTALSGFPIRHDSVE